jgi:hypothetical protein
MAGQATQPTECPPGVKTPPPATQLNGLIAYWAFEDKNPAEQIADLSKNGNDGRAVGATQVDGVRGKALVLNGGAFFDYGSHPSLNFPAHGPFNMACWVNTTAASVVLISQRHSREDGANIDLLLASGRFQAHVRNDRGVNHLAIGTAVTVNDGVWHHCALLRSGNTVEIYVDGQVVGRNSGNQVLCPITTDLRALCRERRWGNVGPTGVPATLTAAVDEFCIFNRALAPGEIRTLAGRD